MGLLPVKKGSRASAKLPAGTIHAIIPKDLLAELNKRPQSATAWLSLTPLARNEWICWVESAKLIETRARRVQRTYTELAEGKRRPCCWPGCIHREKNGK